MNFEPCNLAKLIKKEDLELFFKRNPKASAEIDCTFLGFEEIYEAVSKIVPKGSTIIDLGCAYALQNYYFRGFKQYIGVDAENINPIIRGNDKYYFNTTIQKFIAYILPTLNLKNEKIFAICSYVPDKEARELVKRTFSNCLVYYPF